MCETKTHKITKTTKKKRSILYTKRDTFHQDSHTTPFNLFSRSAFSSSFLRVLGIIGLGGKIYILVWRFALVDRLSFSRERHRDSVTRKKRRAHIGNENHTKSCQNVILGISDKHLPPVPNVVIYQIMFNIVYPHEYLTPTYQTKKNVNRF